FERVRHSEEKQGVEYRHQQVRRRLTDQSVVGVLSHVGRKPVVLLVRTRAVPSIDERSDRAGHRIGETDNRISGSDVPTAMGEPKALQVRRVRVPWHIRVTVMKTMVACPLNWCTCWKAQRHCSALEPLGNSQRSMRQNSVVTEIDGDAREEIIDKAIKAEQGGHLQPPYACPSSSS